jgi:hypothetical protein
MLQQGGTERQNCWWEIPNMESESALYERHFYHDVKDKVFPAAQSHVGVLSSSSSL